MMPSAAPTLRKMSVIRYPVVIEIGNEKTAYGVVVPDLPGVFSAGDTLDEALKNAGEAILFGLEDYVERGEALPTPTQLELLRVGKNGKGGAEKFPPTKWDWFAVDVDISKLEQKVTRNE